ncbi:hypothetical protein OIU78_010905 [Salix suchowensis]|nr:hypothetical protein OIU78_010905 [Salix suchowensis]
MTSSMIWLLLVNLSIARTTWLPHHHGLFMELKKVDLIRFNLGIGKSDIIKPPTDQPGDGVSYSCNTVLHSLTIDREKVSLFHMYLKWDQHQSRVVSSYICTALVHSPST